MVSINPKHKIWAFLMSAALFSGAHASSSVSSSTTNANANANATLAAGPPMITMPIFGVNEMEYNVYLTDDTGQVATAGLDVYQPNLWFLNQEQVICYSTGSTTTSPYTLPSANYSSFATDACNELYGYTPMMTTTFTTGSLTSTVTTFATTFPTTSPLNITYPYVGYASGFFANANFSLNTLGNSSSTSSSNNNNNNNDNANANGLSVGSVSYLLVNSTNYETGSFGLAGPSRGNGVFDNLKAQNLIYGNGYSLYSFSEVNDEDLGGYLLLGSVDQKLYTGNLYAFPQIPHQGWGDSNSLFPILQLDSVSLLDLTTSQSASMYSGGSIPAMIDFTQSQSALPRSFIINLALQTNAVYVSNYDSWVFNCSQVNNINASFQFSLGPLSVSVPFGALIRPTYISNLTFSDGSLACTFNVYPSEKLGFNLLGANILQYMYFAMDNEGGVFAAANANTNVKPNLSSTASQNSSTVGYIRSGYIPFATTTSYSNNPTFTFGLANASASVSNTGLFSNAIITSGHVYLSSKKISSLRTTVAASAATTRSRSGGAGSFNNALKEHNNSVIYAILLIGGIIGLVVI